MYKNYEALASAIVGQACEDYCYAIRNKNKYKEFKDNKGYGGKKYRESVKIIKDCKEFFKNEIKFYMENPPEYDDLIKRLRYVAYHPKQFQIVRFLKNTSSDEVEV